LNDQRKDLSRIPSPSIQGNPTDYDKLLGYDPSKQAQPIPREGRGLQILQPPYDIEPNEPGLHKTMCCAIWSLRTGQPRVNKTSSNVTRTLEVIYLRPAQNQQGGHELMDLNSGQLISRNIVHEIPVTDVVIKAVENMAYQQGFKRP
jgi:hypothetical protein